MDVRVDDYRGELINDVEQTILNPESPNFLERLSHRTESSFQAVRGINDVKSVGTRQISAKLLNPEELESVAKGLVAQDENSKTYHACQDLANNLVRDRGLCPEEDRADWDSGTWTLQSFSDRLCKEGINLFDLFLFVVVASNLDYKAIMPALLRGLCRSYFKGQLQDKDAERLFRIASADKGLLNILEEDKVYFSLPDDPIQSFCKGMDDLGEIPKEELETNLGKIFQKLQQYLTLGCPLSDEKIFSCFEEMHEAHGIDQATPWQRDLAHWFNGYTFIIGAKKQKLIVPVMACSRFICLLKSKMLQALLTRGFKEAHQGIGSANAIPLYEVSKHQLQCVYRWMQTETIDIQDLSVDHVCEMLDSMEYFSYKKFKQGLESYLVSVVDDKNLPFLLEIACQQNMLSLLIVCINKKYEGIVSLSILPDGCYTLIENDASKVAKHPELRELLTVLKGSFKQVSLKYHGKDFIQKPRTWKQAVLHKVMHPRVPTLVKGIISIIGAVGTVRCLNTNKQRDVLRRDLLAAIDVITASPLIMGVCGGVAATYLTWRVIPLSLLDSLQAKIGALIKPVLVPRPSPLVINPNVPLVAPPIVQEPIIGTLSAERSLMCISAKDCRYLTDNALVELVATHADLQELTLEGECPKITSQGWETLAYLSKLSRLSISFNIPKNHLTYPFEALSLRELILSWPNFKEVNIYFTSDGDTRLSPRDIKFFENCPLTCDVNLYVKDANWIKAIADACPGLTSLHGKDGGLSLKGNAALALSFLGSRFRSFTNFVITEGCLLIIAQRCHEIRSLKLLVGLSQQTLAELVHYCPYLEEIHLVYDSEEPMTDECLVELTRLVHLKKLEIVNGNISDEGLRHFLQRDLELISFMNCPRVSADMLRTLRVRCLLHDSPNDNDYQTIRS